MTLAVSATLNQTNYIQIQFAYYCFSYIRNVYVMLCDHAVLLNIDDFLLRSVANQQNNSVRLLKRNANLP